MYINSKGRKIGRQERKVKSSSSILKGKEKKKAEKGARDWNSGMAPAFELPLLCVVLLPVWGKSPTCYVMVVLPGPLHGVGVDLFSLTYLHFKNLGLDFSKKIEGFLKVSCCCFCRNINIFKGSYGISKAFVKITKLLKQHSSNKHIQKKMASAPLFFRKSFIIVNVDEMHIRGTLCLSEGTRQTS